MNKESFLGYGSPQAIEATIRSNKDEHLEMFQEGLCKAIVCSDLFLEEVVSRMAKRPSGTKGGWQLVSDSRRGISCRSKVGFKHYLFEC